MSDFLIHPIPLIPLPQNLRIDENRWMPDPRWQRFTINEGCRLYRIDALNEEEAMMLKQRLNVPSHGSPEAYSALIENQGVAVCANSEPGLRHFQSTLAQMELLALDERGAPQCRIEDWPDLEVRGVHLDLKYQMHRIDYLHEWLEELARMKINTLLLEYEDKFPFTAYPEIVAPDAFSAEGLRAFLDHARKLGLRVVPLFQTLGHWEFILRHERFRSLRGGEAGEYQTEVRPNDPQALEMIFELIDEIIAFHSEDEWFHVGGDEPWYLRKRFANDHDGLVEAFGSHMRKVCEYVIAQGKRPLMYEDVIRGLPPEALKAILRQLPQQTILCFWDYSSGTDWPEKTGRAAVEIYQAEGFDLLGLPCHNWGSIVPYYTRHTTRNTVEMIAFSAERKALGIINTTWACFRVPLPLSDLGISITGDRSWKLRKEAHCQTTEAHFSRLKFGLNDRRVIDALCDLGQQLEFPTTLGRPLHLPHFYYMDAVVQYGGHLFREQLGSSLDLYDNADYEGIVESKLKIVNASDERGAAISSLLLLTNLARTAGETLAGLRPDVSRGERHFALLEWAAAFKALASARMLTLLNAIEAPSSPTELLERSRQVSEDFGRLASWFLAPEELKREQAALFRGETALLEKRMMRSEPLADIVAR